MHILVKTFMVDATDLQVKYVVVNAWIHNPKVQIIHDQGCKAVDALARRVQTRDQLYRNVVSLLTDHLQPESVTVTVN